MRAKAKTENFRGTRNRRIFFERLQWKVGIFIATRNIFNHFYSLQQIPVVKLYTKITKTQSHPSETPFFARLDT